MYERFTDRARRVVVLAQEHARVACHETIDLPHILAALVSEGEGVAAQVLTDLGVTDVDLGEHGTSMPPGHLNFTPQAKKVMELSLREALQLGHGYIGTEHMLLALIREGGIEALIPTSLGEARRAVIDKLSGYAGTRPTPMTGGTMTDDNKVQGRCPSCGRDSLFLGSGGYVTCNIDVCKDPGAASDALAGGYEAMRRAVDFLETLADGGELLVNGVPWREMFRRFNEIVSDGVVLPEGRRGSSAS